MLKNSSMTAAILAAAVFTAEYTPFVGDIRVNSRSFSPAKKPKGHKALRERRKVKRAMRKKSRRKGD